MSMFSVFDNVWKIHFGRPKKLGRPITFSSDVTGPGNMIYF